MYICNANFLNVKPSVLKIMEKEKHELEVVHGIEKVNGNTLSHVKGGISDPAKEKCCDIQFSCNNKGGKETIRGILVLSHSQCFKRICPSVH